MMAENVGAKVSGDGAAHPVTDVELERIRDNIDALRTALNFQVALLHDLEKTLGLQTEVTFGVEPKIQKMTGQ